MPRVVIKMFPGRTQEQKEKLSKLITQAVMESIGVEEKSISIAVEEVPREDWVEQVYKPDIEGKADTLLKKPGYNIEAFEK